MLRSRKWYSVFAVCCSLFALSACEADAADLSQSVDDAKALAKAGDLVQAQAACQSVIDARPGLPVEPRARLVMGYILIKAKAPVESITGHFTQAANSFPSSPEAAEAMHCMGHLALRAGNPELAIERFKDSAGRPSATSDVLRESLVEAGYAHISAYWKTADKSFLARAIEHFNGITEQVDGENAIKVRLGLGEAWMIRGFGKEAAKHYKAALDLRPEDPFLLGSATFELGCALYASKDYEGAVVTLTGFLESQEGQTLADKDSAWRAGRPGYSELAAVSPDDTAQLSGLDLIPDAVYWKAMALLQLKRPAEAREQVDKLSLEFETYSQSSRVSRLKTLLGAEAGGKK